VAVLLTARLRGVEPTQVEGETTVSTENSKAIIDRLSEALRAQDLETLDELLAPEYVNHSLGLEGPEGYKQYCTMLFQAFPDYDETVADMIAEGDKIAVRSAWSGTHRGEFAGIAPTGNRVTDSAAFNIYRIAGGKIVEEWDLYDSLGFFQQLGIIPPIGGTEE
jgi:predicted ester cyclase